MATATQRIHGASIQSELVAHASQIGYVELRPYRMLYEQQLMDAFAEHPGEIVFADDCSALTIVLFHMCGMRDPSHNNYNGEGNSFDIRDRNPTYTNGRLALSMATVTWLGTHRGNVGHVVTVHKADPVDGNPTVFNHGGPGAKLLTKQELDDWFDEVGLYNNIGAL
jgi:hypothetical protein